MSRTFAYKYAPSVAKIAIVHRETMKKLLALLPKTKNEKVIAEKDDTIKKQRQEKAELKKEIERLQSILIDNFSSLKK